MKLIAPAITLYSLCAAQLGLSAPTASIDGYGVTIPEWEVEVSPGGPTIKVNGTIQEVRAELLKHNPDWDTHYPDNATERNIPEGNPSLNKRGIQVAGGFCRGRWDDCDANRIRQGITYLRRVRGFPSRGPGPGNCNRVSCSYNAAIYWCNDARQKKWLWGGFNDIADGAAYILDQCEYWFQKHHKYVSGQVFSTSDWNVIVSGGDRC